MNCIDKAKEYYRKNVAIRSTATFRRDAAEFAEKGIIIMHPEVVLMASPVHAVVINKKLRFTCFEDPNSWYVHLLVCDSWRMLYDSIKTLPEYENIIFQRGERDEKYHVHNYKRVKELLKIYA